MVIFLLSAPVSVMDDDLARLGFRLKNRSSIDFLLFFLLLVVVVAVSADAMVRGPESRINHREDSRRAKYGGKTSWREMAGRWREEKCLDLPLDLSLDTTLPTTFEFH